MSKKASTGIYPSGTAVEFIDVAKLFIQNRRGDEGKGFFTSFWRPQKTVVKALDNVSFKIERGEFVAYAGPNGAGKSTTMKLMSGMLLPSEGEIRTLGAGPGKNRIALMKRIGVLFGQRTELWWDHPVSQSFEWKKAVWDIPDQIYKENLALVRELLDIGSIEKTFARELSLGQRLRADLALMLLHSPSLILLDEPTLGLDVVAKRQMIGFLKELNRDKGVTIIVTSHDMDDLEEMAKRIIMISGGKLAFDGSFERLRLHAGALSHLTVIASDATMPAELGAPLSAENGVYEYELDLANIPIKKVLAALSHLEGVRDIEIKKAPIEQVTAGLFRSWRQG